MTPYLAWKKDNDFLLAECSRQSARRKRVGRYTSVHKATGEGLLQEYFYTHIRQMATEARQVPGESELGIRLSEMNPYSCVLVPA